MITIQNDNFEFRTFALELAEDKALNCFDCLIILTSSLINLFQNTMSINFIVKEQKLFTNTFRVTRFCLMNPESMTSIIRARPMIEYPNFSKNINQEEKNNVEIEEVSKLQFLQNNMRFVAKKGCYWIEGCDIESYHISSNAIKRQNIIDPSFIINFTAAFCLSCRIYCRQFKV